MTIDVAAMTSHEKEEWRSVREQDSFLNWRMQLASFETNLKVLLNNSYLEKVWLSRS